MCPYVRRSDMRYAYINYNDDGVENGSLVVENYENEECQREKCGAWYDGKCNFNE